MTDQYRLPPHDYEAEDAVLASALVKPSLIDELSTIVTGADFYREINAWTWDAIMALHKRHEPVNQITVASQLAKLNHLEEVGGQAHLADLIRWLPTPVGADWYARAVKQFSQHRKMLGLGSYITEAAFAASVPPDGLVEKVYTMLSEILGTASSDKDWQTAEEVAKSGYMDALAQRMNTPDAISGIPTGIGCFDRKLGGFKNGKLYIIGANTSVGKSSFVADMIRRMSEYRHAVFTTEMAAQDYLDRMVYQIAKIDKEMVQFRNPPKYTAVEIEALGEALAEAKSYPVYFNDKSALTLNYVNSSLRRLMARQGIEMVWIDHIDTMANSNANTAQLLTDISLGFKAYAREANVPVCYTSQRSRSGDNSGNINSSLRGSGGKEDSADVTIFLVPVNADTNEELPQDEARAQASNPGWTKFKVVIGKNRGGTTGTVEMYCDYRHGGRWGDWLLRPKQWSVRAS